MTNLELRVYTRVVRSAALLSRLLEKINRN